MLPVKLTPTIFCVLFSLNFTRCATQKRPMKSMALAYVDTIQYLVPWHKYLLNNINKKRKKKKRRKKLLIFSCTKLLVIQIKTKDCTVSILKQCKAGTLVFWAVVLCCHVATVLEEYTAQSLDYVPTFHPVGSSFPIFNASHVMIHCTLTRAISAV